ncbi:hypothetical protein H5410_051771, partial [Solanum commersonii]
MELTSFEKASKMWSHLHTRGNQQNLAREFELERLLVESTQGDKNSKTSFLLPLSLWMDRTFKDFMATMKRIRTIQFLMNLRPEFEYLCANILNRKKLPGLDVVVCEVLREEFQLSSQDSMKNSLTMDIAMAAYKDSSFSGNSNKRIQCYHINKTGHDGHIILECRKKFGLDKRSTPYKTFQAIARDVGTQETPSLKAHQAPILLDHIDIYK